MALRTLNGSSPAHLPTETLLSARAGWIDERSVALTELAEADACVALFKWSQRRSPEYGLAVCSAFHARAHLFHLDRDIAWLDGLLRERSVGRAHPSEHADLCSSIVGLRLCGGS